MISNKKFLLLSLLMAPAAKADCGQENNCCTTEPTCVRSPECTNSDQVACDEARITKEGNECCNTTCCEMQPEDCTKSCQTDCDTQKSPECVTCETETTKASNECCNTPCCKIQTEGCSKSCEDKCNATCDQVDCTTKTTECMTCETKNTDCNSCCCQMNNETTEVVRSENFDNNENENVIIEETEEQAATRIKFAATAEAEKTFEVLFKMLSLASQAYLSLSPNHKTAFAKTLVDFLFNVQQEIKAHGSLFEKIGPDYIKACKNLEFNFVEVAEKSEEENLKDKFSYFASKLAQFYVDFGYIYKNLNLEEQAELAQVFSNVYSEQKEACKDNAVVLGEIVEVFGKAISAR